MAGVTSRAEFWRSRRMPVVLFHANTDQASSFIHGEAARGVAWQRVHNRDAANGEEFHVAADGSLQLYACLPLSIGFCHYGQMKDRLQFSDGLADRRPDDPRNQYSDLPKV